VHGHGHSFRLVATDGNAVPIGMEWVKDTFFVGPAERVDLEFDSDNPGVWMFHCHIEHHMANGMMTVLAYEGAVPTGPAVEYFDLATGGTTGHDAHEPAPAPTPEPTEEPAEVAAVGMAPDDGATISMVDDRFEPVTLEIPAGTTVTWVNDGADWHSVAAYDGSFESGKIAPGASYSVTLTEPGTIKYICKHHGLQGMIGQIIVT
jgi:plastocyanin